MTPPSRGAKPLDELMRRVLDEALAARGLGKANLIADWRAIVGDSIACYARPLQLRWLPRTTNCDPEPAVAQATLVLAVDGAFVLEAQHNAAIIVERVNSHLGWRCVETIAFRQGPLPPLREKRNAAPAPSTASEDRARQAAETIRNEGLRESLTRFGARVIDRASRRRPAVDDGNGD
jgi:hypothetical protein